MCCGNAAIAWATTNFFVFCPFSSALLQYCICVFCSLSLSFSERARPHNVGANLICPTAAAAAVVEKY